MSSAGPRALGRVNSFIGSPVERVEDLRFLRGRGEYVGDLVLPGMLHAVVLRSPMAHGLIRAIDTAAALEMVGVVAVITAADISSPIPTIHMRQEAIPDLTRFQEPVIAEKKVRYVGQPVALVVAESPALAEDAADRIGLEIEPLPVVGNRHDAGLVFEEAGTNLATVMTALRGDGAAGFPEDAPYRRRERFRIPRQCASPMEPRGLLADWDEAAQRLTLYGAAKIPFHNRRVLAKHLDLPEASVDLVENDVGGGFGARGEYFPEDFLVSFAARRLGRPVRWIEDRRENLMATTHAREAEVELEIACRADGTILALRGEAHTDLGAFVKGVGATPSRNIAQVISGPYRFPHIHLTVSPWLSNKTPVGTYRGPGRVEADFSRERLFDMAARDLGLDRVEFRRRNLVSSAEMPYPLANVEPFGLGGECDSGDYAMTLDRCLEEIGWREKQHLQGKEVGGRRHGLGICCYIEGGGSGPKETARLVLEKDGRFGVFVGSSAVGQGLETVFSQIAADALEVPMDRIRGVFHGSTSHVSQGFGTYSSRSVVMGGSAILKAAAQLREKIREAAADKLGCEPEVIEIVEGRAVHEGGSISLGNLAPLEIEAEFGSTKRTYSYGAHAAHVTVDPKTGQVEVLDYVAVEDVGRIINPMTLHGQTMGAIVQGLGGAFLEQLIYDGEGQLLTGTLADYLLPTAGDFPKIHVVALEEYTSPNNPLGAKGAGEGGIISTAGVVANAIAAALEAWGIEPRELPLSPPRLWQLIEDAKSFKETS